MQPQEALQSVCKATSRVPPHSLDAEQAVLAAALLNSKAIPKIQKILAADDFYREAHAYLWEALCSLWQKREAIDLITLPNELNRTGVLEKAGGTSYIAMLADAVSTSAGAEHYAHIVKEHSRRRQVIRQCGVTADALYQPWAEPDAILSEHKAALRQIESIESDDELDSTAAVWDAVDFIQEQSEGDQTVGRLTGFKNIDRYLHGLEPQCTYYLGGFRSSGKSSLALNICNNIGGSIFYFTLESSRRALILRLISIRTGIPLTRLKTGNIPHGRGEWRAIHEASGDIAQSGMHIIDKYRYRQFEALRAFCETVAMDQQIDLIVVDYLQLVKMGGKFNSRRDLYQELSNSFGDLAKELKVPVLILSQLNDEGQLKESRDIEDRADYVLLLDRKGEDNKLAELNCTKGKDLGKWSCWLEFDRFKVMWRDWMEG